MEREMERREPMDSPTRISSKDEGERRPNYYKKYGLNPVV